MPNRAYFTLAIRESGRWTPQFGDHERAVVAQESRDSYAHVRQLDRKIVESAPDCDAIDAALAALNAPDLATEIERFKSEARYYQAGALAAALGWDSAYGCHFGMRSTYPEAVAQYKLGHSEGLIALARELAR